jgi:hypothetical protein
MQPALGDGVVNHARQQHAIGHQRDLHDQQQNPTGEQKTVQVEQRLERRLAEEVPKIVGPRESGEDHRSGKDRRADVEKTFAPFRFDSGLDLGAAASPSLTDLTSLAAESIMTSTQCVLPTFGKAA